MIDRVKLESESMQEVLKEDSNYPTGLPVDERNLLGGDIIRGTDLAVGIVDLYVKGIDRGLCTGWSCLDELYSVSPGELNVITGIPGSGKSEFIDALMINLAESSQWKFALFSPENYPYKIHAEKLIRKRSGKLVLKGHTARLNDEELTKQVLWLSRHFMWMHPNEDCLDLESILGLAREVKDRHDINAFVLDPWNQIAHRRKDGLSETEYISDALATIKQFCNHHQLTCFLVAHPRKLQKNKDGTYEIARPYDIAGSANFFNKADNCLSIYRHKDSPMVTVHVQKVKFATRGQVGKADLFYDDISGRYKEHFPESSQFAI